MATQKNTLTNIKSLVGLRLIKLVDDGNCQDWNGLITGHIKDLVFIQLFDALMGEPTYAICIKENELVSDRYKFFISLEDLENYIDTYQSKYDNHYFERKEKLKQQEIQAMNI